MKKQVWSLLVLTAFGLTLLPQTLTAQKTDKPKKDLKNTIHMNVTNPLIFGNKAIIFGYERVINKHQSFTVNIGSMGFPVLSLINSDSVQMNRTVSDKGFNMAVDYRFYLAKENKYVAPRGIYIGPYYAYNYFSRKNNWFVKSTAGSSINVETELTLNTHTFGFELGYQFILWRRLSIDLILLGPGLGVYDLETSFGSNLSVSDKEKLLQKINDALAEKFPGYTLVVKDRDFENTGSFKTTTLGYRYMVQIGFRF